MIHQTCHSPRGSRTPHVKLVSQRDQSVVRRSGYSLIEVLIASVLTATLLAACWNLMSLYSSFLTAGRQEVTERQLARSLFELVAEDVQRVPLPTAPPPRGALPRSTPAFPLPATGAFAADFTGAARAFGYTQAENRPLADPSVEVIGTRTSLRITFFAEPVSKLRAGSATGADDLPGADLALAAAAEPHTVYYHFAPPEPTTPGTDALPFGLHRIEAGAGELQRTFEAARASSEDTAIAESQANRNADTLTKSAVEMLLFPSEESGDLPEETQGSGFEPTQEHVPEVVRCEFEFHDGNNWITGWNSRQRRSAPVAIRVTLWLIAPEELETVRSILSPDTTQPVVDDSPVLPGFRPRRYQRIIPLASRSNPVTAEQFGESGR